jgi:hypothetical protein
LRLAFISIVPIAGAAAALGDAPTPQIYLDHVVRAMKNPAAMVVVAAFLIAARFFLWNLTWARHFWHPRLEAVGLRKQS